MSIGFSGSFSALGATVGTKGAAAGAGGGGGGPSYQVTDVNFIYNQGNPAAVSYVAMPGGQRTFLSFITSFGVNQNSSNNDNSQWQNSFSGRLTLSGNPRTNNNYFTGYGGVKFISGDGSSDGGDWAVIDWGPDNNGDFDGYYQSNERGRFFGGENSSSGGGANSMRNGRLFGFSPTQGWALLYYLPLGDRNGSYSHRNSNWWSSGNTTTSGFGKYSAYDSLPITHIGFSVQS